MEIVFEKETVEKAQASALDLTFVFLLVSVQAQHHCVTTAGLWNLITSLKVTGRCLQNRMI